MKRNDRLRFMQIQPLPSQTFPPLPHRQLHLSFYPPFLVYYKYMCVCVCIIYNAKKIFPLFEILSLELLTTLFCFFFACILFLSSFLCLFFLYFLVTSGFYPRLAILLHCLSFFLSFNFYPRFVSSSSWFYFPFFLFLFLSHSNLYLSLFL